jgi:hypothetical protein
VNGADTWFVVMPVQNVLRAASTLAVSRSTRSLCVKSSGMLLATLVAGLVWYEYTAPAGSGRPVLGLFPLHTVLVSAK